MTTAILVVVGQWTAPSDLLLILLSLICGCLVFASLFIMAHSLVFWLGSVESVARQYCNSLTLFTCYPTNIYSGPIQILMFTLIPAGVITYLPVELLRHFSWTQLLLLTGSAAAFFCTAFCVFYLGLKRYESGNQFGVRL